MSLKYRADIDGLRALAVLLVVLYHAKLPVPGGFVGVDVFFVISGYLITTILDKEIRDSRFSYLHFYIRRVTRLIPALFFMLIIVSVYCSYFLMPEDLLSYGKTAVLTLLGISNFYFYAHTNYFESSSFEPLLHTWSLAVEEQYYLFWPLILLATYRIKRTSIKAFVFSGLFITSVVMSWYYVNHDKNLAYMMLPFRFFELMAGALLAINYRRIERINRYKEIISFGGLTFILASAYFLNDRSLFPGVLALPVTFGTVMLLAAQGGTVNRFLSLTPVVYTGKVSYSFYLWHWPIIILAEYQGIELTTLNALALIVLSFFMACLSYHVVESPFRKLRSAYVVFPLLYAAPLAVSFIFMLYMVTTSGLKWRTDGLFDELDSANSAHIQRDACMEKMKIGNIKECWLGVKKDKPDILMIGDSFGNAYTPFIDVLAKDAGLMVTDTMRSSTPSIPGVFVEKDGFNTSQFNASEIAYYNTKRTQYAFKIGAVIISDYFDKYTGENPGYKLYDANRVDYTKNAYRLRVNYLKTLVKAGVKVFIIARPFDTIGNNGVAKLRNEKFNKISKHTKFPYGMKKELREEYRLKAGIPEIIIIDPNEILCSDQLCDATIDGDIIFRTDGTHLNYSSARKIATEYLKLHRNPFR